MWFLFYGVAIFLDLAGALLGFFVIGLVINRIIAVFALAGFLFAFLVSGVDLIGAIKKSALKIILSSFVEMVPIAGEIFPGWFAIVRLIHKNQPQPVAEEAVESKEEIVAQQTEEDQGYQQQQA